MLWFRLLQRRKGLRLQRSAVDRRILVVKIGERDAKLAEIVVRTVVNDARIAEKIAEKIAEIVVRTVVNDARIAEKIAERIAERIGAKTALRAMLRALTIRQSRLTEIRVVGVVAIGAHPAQVDVRTRLRQDRLSPNA